MSKKGYKVLWVVVCACLVAVLAYGLFLSRNKAELIILYDIRTANAIVPVIVVIAAVLLILANLLFAAGYRKWYRVKPPTPAPQAQQPGTQANVDVSSERYIRSQLMYFLGIRPRLREQLQACLEQIDGINKMVSSLSNVRMRRDAAFLEIAEESLEKAKDSILDNMKAVINVAEIWNPKEAGEPAWSDIYKDRLKLIAAAINLNDDYLKQSAILLTKATDLANKKALTDEGKNDLEATITVIDQLGTMGGVMGAKK